MTTEVDSLESLRSLQAAVLELRAAVERMEDIRDAAIRRYCARAGVNRSELARELGMSRAGLYKVLALAHGEDGEPDVDALEYLDRLWDIALDAWQSAGFEGDPDEYFPLEAVVRGD